MPGTTLEFLKEQIELNEQLVAGRKSMIEPHDLPGRYGRVVKSVNHLLEILQCEAVLGGGWAGSIRAHLQRKHDSYVQEFDLLVKRAGEEEEK
jgi:hypothetical protein